MAKVFTQKEAVLGYKALEKISGQEVGWKTAYWLMKLKKQLQGQFDFQRECEQKLFDKYHPEQDGGQFKFRTPEEAQEFVRELEEIGKIELTDMKIRPVEIPEAESLKLSLADMEALDGFVEFREEEVPELQLVMPEEEEHGNADAE